MDGRCYLYSPNLFYPNPPKFSSSRDLVGKTGFTSLYSVSEQDAKSIVAAGTAKAFAGCVWSERLWIDVDDYAKAEEIERLLKEREYDYVAYDSGGKGAHFGILRDTPPSHLLPYQDKQWVKENLPQGYCDTSIYTHLHLFRLPGTVHEKTGRRKELVSEQRGKSITLPKYETGNVKVVVRDFNSTVNSVFSNFRVMSSSVPVPIGQRHGSLVRLAYALKEASVPQDKALWWVSETNKLFEEPKDEKEVDKIIQDVYSDPR